MVKAMLYYIKEIGGNTFYASKIWLEFPKLAFHCIVTAMQQR